MAPPLYHTLSNEALLPIFRSTLKEKHMRSVAKTSRKFLGDTLAVFGAAVAVSSAVRAHRKPGAADLDTLGIDRQAFDNVRL